MAQLDIEIAQARRIIADLQSQIAEQERLLRGLESWLGQLGLDTEGGRQARRAVEQEIVRKRQIIDGLKRVLEGELRRLRQLEERLQRLRPGPAPIVPT